MRGAAGLAFCATILLVPQALAERAGVRLGEHPTHGRIVLDLAAPDIPYTIREEGEATLLRLAPGTVAELPATRRLPRNILSLGPAPDGLRFTTRPGTRLRHFRLGNRLVLDVMDSGPPSPPRAGEPRRPPAPRQAAPAPTAPLPVTSPIPPLADPPRPAEAAAPRPAAIPAQPAPAGLPLRTLASEQGPALLLPLPEETGLAIFRRGELILAVLDGPRPFNLDGIRSDPVFGRIEAETLPEATILRLPIAAPAALQAQRQGHHWLLTLSPAGAREATILPEPGEGRVQLRATAPGRPIPVADPETGLPILVGTVHQGGQAVSSARSLAQVDLLPTQLGVAALARADTVALRRSGDHFLLLGVSGAIRPGPDPAGTEMSRLMELPRLDPAAGQERLRAQHASLAAAPPLTRMPLRRAAAEGMLALGLAQEAQAMIRLAFQEDPRASSDPRSILLNAAAALLANRLPEARPLATAEMPANDEVTLWRALLAAMEGDASAAAPGLARTLPLLLGYPEPMRARLLPLAAEALQEAGDAGAARQLLQSAGDLPFLALARARMAEAEGRAEEALSLYATLASGRDRLVRARALRRAAELRLASGTLDAAGAAAALEAALFAWRGDAEELGLRLRIAALRGAAGNARAALDLLKDTAAIYPDQGDRIRPAQEAAFLQAIGQEPPLTAAALWESQPALLPKDQRGATALASLADRLAAMELPDRGVALMEQALDRAAPAQRPALAMRLAELRLAAGKPAAALHALEAVPDDPENALSRGLVAARARSALGAGAEAVSILRGLGAPALPALAALLAERQDWIGASDAFIALSASRPEDPATPQHVLRAAAFAALGGDAARLAAIRAAWLQRIGQGSLAEALALLTADPARGLSDLPRLQRELDLFRGFPNKLEAFRTADASSR
ncbi:hypothetical protein J8J14_15820 [Roseomonas sp. SSH11]|uniref:Tetratricopeptide repeat protein n=1 Tax=Pararoseomonas baculiformis TaxID=2820812 RepID=A0ABS4AGU1_9PROT|nr:hypothetical protein [Pararoseomonas baculiformis]MBP0446241.1 hypothetical protein [Pararoseomonas baculiformis]